MVATLGLTAILTVAEAIGGVGSGSLALLADAGHMLTDLLALGVALAALTLAERPADHRRTFGFRRLEVLAALANSVALVGVAGGIVVQAVLRFLHPAPVQLPTMMGVAALGLVVNLAGLALLGHSRDDLNLRSVFLHLVGDTLSSLGVVVGGAIMGLTGWQQIDPALSILIAGIIMVGAYNLLREVIDVLLEAAPRGLDVAALRQDLLGMEGISGVHDLHVWSIASGMPALSAHLVMSGQHINPQDVLIRTHAHLQTQWHIEHATLQVEHPPCPHCGCGEVTRPDLDHPAG